MDGELWVGRAMSGESHACVGRANGGESHGSGEPCIVCAMGEESHRWGQS